MEKLPFYNRIVFLILIPVIVVGIVCSTLLVAALSSPLKDYLTHQYDANLQLSSNMGLQICEDSFSYLLDLRLEKNLEMNELMQFEALNKIKNTSNHFPYIQMMVLKSGQSIIANSLDGIKMNWQEPNIGNLDDSSFVFELDKKLVRAHVQYFPFWDWHIMSYVFDRDYQRPIQMAFSITYLNAGGVFLAVFLTLLIVFQLYIKRPLNRLIKSTDGIADGSLTKISKIDRTEFGRLMSSFNGMVDSLENEKEEVASLIDKLRKSEALFRSQFEFGNIGIAIFSPDLKTVLTNKRLGIILEYNEEELKMINWAELGHPDDLVIEKNQYEKMVAGKIDSYEMEKRVIKKSGEIVFSHVSVSCDRNPDKSIRIVIASLLDITDRKKAEAEAQQSYLQLKSIYNSLPIIVWSLDEKGVFTMSEGNELKSIGRRPGEVVGRSVFDVYEGNDSVIEGVKNGLNGSIYESEMFVRENVYHTVVTPVFDESNNVQKVHGFAVNVTARKKAEDELRRLRNYLSNIIDSMPSVLIGVDMNGHITQWNKEAQKKTGVSPESATGQPLAKAFPRLSREMERVKEAIEQKQVRSNSRRALEEEGNTRYENIVIFPLVSNGVDGAVIRLDDVTEQVRLEEMMVQSEKMLSVGGLAAGMAHEINNPLAGMIQTANVMSSRLKDTDIPANLHAAKEVGISMEKVTAFMEKRSILRMLHAIKESGMQVAEIVNNMLSFARKTDAVFSSHDPAELLDQILELASTDYDLRKQFDFKNIKIIKDYQKNLPMMLCEKPKIQQVLLNILRNGAHAMLEKRSTSDQPSCFILTIKTEKQPKMIRIEIEDNGIGMTQETQKRVFEPFFTTKEPGIGTGLGLSVSYFIIVENHNGTLDVNSKLNKGTKFIIRLPYG